MLIVFLNALNVFVSDSEDSPPRKVTVSMPRKTAECKLTLDEHQNNMIQESGNLI